MEVRQIRCGWSNCWLIKEQGHAVLVDTGAPGYGRQIEAQIACERVELIILTHGHIDHIGGTAYLIEKQYIPVMMHPSDVILTVNPTARPLKCCTMRGQLLGFFSEKMLHKKAEPFRLTHLAEEGMRLDEWRISASIVTLPGHTEGSIGVLTDDGALIAGDALMHIGSVTAPLIYENSAAVEATLEKIGRLGVKWICPGHGKAFEAGQYF